MKIILVRHGESEHNAGVTDGHDTPLTKRGKLQAEFLGKKLRKSKIKIDRIYTSELIRSKQTAEIISKILKIPVKESFEGFNEYHHTTLKNPLKKIFNLRMKRLKKFLKKITETRNENKTIIIVAHGITNRIIIGYLLQIPLKRSIRLNQHNSATSLLSWNNNFNNWNLVSMNDETHLPEKLK